MCQKPKPGEKVIPIRCQRQTHPCPTCGRHGRRKRRLERFVRTGAVALIRAIKRRFSGFPWRHPA